MRAPSSSIILNVQWQLLFLDSFPKSLTRNRCLNFFFTTVSFSLVDISKHAWIPRFLSQFLWQWLFLSFCSSRTWFHIPNTVYRQGTKCASYSRQVKSEGELLCWRVLWLTREQTGFTRVESNDIKSSGHSTTTTLTDDCFFEASLKAYWRYLDSIELVVSVT